MDIEVQPEPSEPERRAIVLALREDADVGRATAKPWRGAAADDAGEESYATARPRKSRGATRA